MILNQVKKLAHAVLYDAFKDLASPKLRDRALAFLSSEKVVYWAELADRSTTDIKNKAQEIYNNPKLLPRNCSRSGNRSKYY